LKIIEAEQQLQHEEENMSLAEIYPLEDDVNLIVILKERREL
jgi:hypothetical protein